jgi:threonine-phosphate decarboxylase
MMKKIRSKCIPWRINTLSLAALDYLIEHWYDTASAASMMMAETRRLHAMLDSIPGITALPTATHFFLVNIGLADCHELSAKLMSRYGILVRCADNFRGLDNHFIRISTQTPEENDILVKAIEECISQ